MWEIINFAISTKSVISPLTKINIKNSLIEDSLQKLLIALNNFLLKLVILLLTMSIKSYIQTALLT